MKETILITGATGKTGGEAAYELLKQGYKVRALVHREDVRSERLRKAGAETVIGNLLSLEDITNAMRGTQRAYFVCPWTLNQLDIGLNFAVAAEETKVEHVVVMSQWLSSPMHPAVATRRIYLTDKMMSWLPGIKPTFINVGFFADNYMALLEPIAQLGLLPLPLGEGKNAPVSNGDIGRVVAAALMYPEKYSGKTYRPCGPSLLSPEEIAQSFSRVLKRPVKYQNISEKMFLKATRSMGYPTGLISQLRYYFQEYRDGAFAAGAPNDAVENLTGRDPEDFDTIIQHYVSAKNQVTGLIPQYGGQEIISQNFSNKLRAVSNFIGLLLTAAPDLHRFEKEQEFPEIDAARKVFQHDYWRETHMQPNAFGG
ncbi:MAG: NmrA family NAD(P)-binding protein [Desulfocapsaceae bacterium]|nr:NmrA family NAD(P)-binding protein [Desulfocapsaceae bacterium]